MTEMFENKHQHNKLSCTGAEIKYFVLDKVFNELTVKKPFNK